MQELKVKTNKDYILQIGRELLSVCDGARRKDFQGYNKPDAYTARTILSFQNPSDNQVEFLRKILLKYKNQILNFGFDYDTLKIVYHENEEEENTAKGIEVIHSLEKINKNSITHTVLFHGDWDNIMAMKDRYKNEGYHYNPDNKSWNDNYTLKNEQERTELKVYLSEKGMKLSDLDIIDEIEFYLPEVIFRLNENKILEIKINAEWKDLKNITPILKNYSCEYKPDEKLWYLSGIDEKFFNELKNMLINHNIRVIDNSDNYFNKEVEKIKNIDSKNLKIIENKYPFLYPFQKIDVVRAIKDYSFGLFWEMGAGKTIASLSIIKNTDLPVLVVLPQTIINVWEENNKKFSFNLEEQIIWGKSPAKRKICYSNFKKINYITYETLASDVNSERFNPIQDFIIVFDEASKVKTSNSKRTKALLKVRKNKYCKGAVGLTGTPFENYLTDVWSICNIIKPGFMTKKEFDNKYCNYVFEKIYYKDRFGNVQSRMIPVLNGYKNLNMFKRIIDSFTSRIKKSDVLPDLPSKTWEYRFIEMTNEQKKIENEMVNTVKKNKRGMFTIYSLLRTLVDGLEYLAQSESTYVPESVSNEKKYKNPKTDEVVNILNEIGDNQVIIFSDFERPISGLYEFLKAKGYDVIKATGATKKTERGKIVSDMNEGKHQILLATDVFTYGISMPHINYIINYDIHFNPGKMNQRADRIHRADSLKSESKTIICLVSGIEKNIYEILREKNSLFEEVVEGQNIKNVDMMKLLEKKYGFEDNSYDYSESEKKDLEIGDEYSGIYQGNIYHVDAKGEPFEKIDNERRYIINPEFLEVGKQVLKMKGGGQFILTEKGDFITKILGKAPIYLGHTDNLKIEYKKDDKNSLKFEDIFE